MPPERICPRLGADSEDPNRVESNSASAASISEVPGSFFLRGGTEWLISTAFHHLTYTEKVETLAYLDTRLEPGGKIVIADTMFGTQDCRQNLLARAETRGFKSLLNDLETEFYELVEDITRLFSDLQYTYDTEQMNQYVWLIIARKPISARHSASLGFDEAFGAHRQEERET